MSSLAIVRCRLLQINLSAVAGHTGGDSATHVMFCYGRKLTQEFIILSKYHPFWSIDYNASVATAGLYSYILYSHTYVTVSIFRRCGQSFQIHLRRFRCLTIKWKG